jgi:fatty acid/phospholipid biosynthesis enzyme
VVIKAHGASSAYAFKNAIRLARRMVAGKVIDKMRGYLQEHPIERSDESDQS